MQQTINKELSNYVDLSVSDIEYLTFQQIKGLMLNRRGDLNEIR